MVRRIAHLDDRLRKEIHQTQKNAGRRSFGLFAESFFVFVRRLEQRRTFRRGLKKEKRARVLECTFGHEARIRSRSDQ